MIFRQSCARAWRVPVGLFFSLSLLSCSSVQPPERLTPKEQIQVDNDLGQQLVPSFEKSIKLYQNADVSVFLRTIAAKLARTQPNLEQSPVGVFLTDDPTQSYRNYALPGVRIYLSRSFLKKCNHDSEIAAAIGIQLSHVLQRHLIKSLGTFDQDSLRLTPVAFVFTDSDRLSAIRESVRFLYLSGYDPRGVVALLDLYRAHPGSSPYSLAFLEQAESAVYAEIARFTPLRNPVVRTDRFLSLKNRIRKL